MDLDNRRLALKLARECGIAEPSTQKLEKFITLAFEAWNRRAEAQWQPIETAPKELGKRILGLKDCGEGTLTSISIVFWLNDGEWHINDCAPRTAEGFGYRVTHWMPLPAEPEVKHANKTF